MLPKRKNLRLKNYDYSQPGAYFVTICCLKRRPLFGEINDAGEMVLNDIGRMIVAWYLKIAKKFTRVQCDEFVCMYDHVHMIIQILSTNDVSCGAAQRPTPTVTLLNNTGNERGPTHGSAPTVTLLKDTQNVGADPCVRPYLYRIVQWFKTQTTNNYIKGVKQRSWPEFDGKLWQRGYYERVLRNENELFQAREYIANNPRLQHTEKESLE